MSPRLEQTLTRGATEEGNVGGSPIKDKEVVLPPEFARYHIPEAAKPVIADLLQLGEKVKQAADVTQKTASRQAFEETVDNYFDDPRAAFLLSKHPVYDVNWLGYLRYCLGEAVGGKKALPFRDYGRGVSDKSGRHN